jgi:hypothetical protein
MKKTRQCKSRWEEKQIIKRRAKNKMAAKSRRKNKDSK